MQIVNKKQDDAWVSEKTNNSTVGKLMSPFYLRDGAPLLGQFLPCLLKLEQNACFIPGRLYKWDTSQNQLTPLFNSHLCTFWTTALLFASLLCGYSVTIFKKQRNIVNVTFGMLCFVITGCAAVCLWCASHNTATCVTFFNGVSQLDKKTKKRVRGLSKTKFAFDLVVCKTLAILDLTTPALFAFVAVFLPCVPPNLVALMNPTCSKANESYSFLDWVRIIFFAGVNGLLWKVPASILPTTNIQILVGCLCQKTALQMFRTNHLEGGIMKKLRAYRELQLLNKLFSKSHHGMLFALLVTCTVCFTCLAYILFRTVAPSSSNAVVVPWFITVWNVWVITEVVLALLWIYSQAGEINSSSGKLLKWCMTQGIYMKSREWEKFLMSCAPLKVAFGLSNYIEKTTPLYFMMFAVNRFVELLLLDKRSGNLKRS